MPDEPDERLVPPLKVMRKRLNGVYRADGGFSGPTRRYVLIVALLVGLASIPTLAAITAGSNELSNGKTDTMDVPFLPPASPGPIRTRPPVGAMGSSPGADGSPAPSTPWVPPSLDPTVPPALPPSVRGASQGAQAAVRAGRLLGQVGARADRPAPVRDQHPSQVRDEHPAPDRDEHAAMSGPDASPDREVSSGSTVVAHTGRDHPKHSASSKPSKPPKASKSDQPKQPAPTKPSEPGPAKTGPATSGDNAGDNDGDTDQDPGRPSEPDDPPGEPDRPSCHERGDCETHSSRHRRPDFSRHAQCDNSTHRAHRSHHHAIHLDQSNDWSDHRRRSAVTERPQNIRPAGVLERGYTNSRRVIPEARNPESRDDDNQIVNRAYRGNHRLAGQHHADRSTPAQQRDSRVGKHHADRGADKSDDYRNRW